MMQPPYYQRLTNGTMDKAKHDEYTSEHPLAKGHPKAENLGTCEGVYFREQMFAASLKRRDSSK